MIEIQPNALYSKEDLEGLLEPVGLSAEAFIERLKPRKVFRALYYGKDLIEALSTASPIKERSPAPNAHSFKRVRSIKPITASPGVPGQKIIEEFGLRG
ncbi:hypothetical protein LLG95_05545 [bacterium]|nr:hypothetical protein [bacterium]